LQAKYSQNWAAERLHLLKLFVMQDEIKEMSPVVPAVSNEHWFAASLRQSEAWFSMHQGFAGFK